MANIHFSSEKATERFEKCKKFTEQRGDYSLQDCIDRLKHWSMPIMIGCDIDEMSFSFREMPTDELQAMGYRPIRGGIIYHGERDGFGSGAAPTFSICLKETSGYEIHT